MTTAQFHSTKPELRFYIGSNPAHSMLKIHDGEDFWQWSQLEIRQHLSLVNHAKKKTKKNTIINSSSSFHLIFHFYYFRIFFAFLCYGSQFFAKSSFFLLQANIIFILNFLPSERYGYWNNSEWIDLLFFKKYKKPWRNNESWYNLYDLHLWPIL